MTRNQLELLARALKASKPQEAIIGFDDKATEQWEKDVQAIAKVGQETNARFNRSKFYAACGAIGMEEKEN